MKKLSIVFLTGIVLSSSLWSVTLSDTIKNSSLIVYDSNIALVHEERELSLHQPDTSIIYKDVAKSIQKDSVHVEISPDVTLYSQEYRFDTLKQEKLLQSYLGKKVEVRLLRNKNEFKLITATLLAYDEDKSIVRTLDYKIITVKNDNIIFESIPDTLITKPSLIWNIKSKKDVKTTMKLDYLASNINFKSNYILNIEDDKAYLSGWISLNNKSGKSFTSTKLSLVAGDIQKKSLKKYHFYTIPFNVTLPNNKTTQIQFIQDNNISMQRLYSVTLTNPLYLQGQQRNDVSQYIVLSGLSTLLPKGDVRIYLQQNEQKILLGQNTIKHTPKDRDIKLKRGINFDVEVRQTLIKRQESDNYVNIDVEYTLSNNSDSNKTLEVLVPFNTDENSTIKTDETYTFTKGNLVTFSINVETNTTKKFNVNYESKK